MTEPLSKWQKRLEFFCMQNNRFIFFFMYKIIDSCLFYIENNRFMYFSYNKSPIHVSYKKITDSWLFKYKINDSCLFHIKNNRFLSLSIGFQYIFYRFILNALYFAVLSQDECFTSTIQLLLFKKYEYNCNSKYCDLQKSTHFHIRRVVSNTKPIQNKGKVQMKHCQILWSFYSYTTLYKYGYCFIITHNRRQSSSVKVMWENIKNFKIVISWDR